MSDDAVRKFESRMKKVRRLEVAKGYLELYQKADGLSADAKGALKTEAQESSGLLHSTSQSDEQIIGSAA